MTELKAGKTYQTIIVNFNPCCGLTSIGQRFTISYVDRVGDAWSKDVTFGGKKGEWCVCGEDSLEDGSITLVGE